MLIVRLIDIDIDIDIDIWDYHKYISLTIHNQSINQVNTYMYIYLLYLASKYINISIINL